MSLSSADIAALFLEKNVSEQCSHGGAAHLLMEQFALVGPTAQFRREELGLGWGEYPSILEVLRTVRADNRRRRDRAVKFLNAAIRPVVAEAKKKGIRTTATVLDVDRGCIGCSSCVPEARLRPFRTRHAVELAAWVPRHGRSFEEASAMRRARIERSRELAAERAARDERQRKLVERDNELVGDRASLALRQLDDVHRRSLRPRSDARPQMQARRKKFKALEQAVRRAVED